jgi:hypothetical protein
MIRDVPLSKCCISRQRFCSVAIAWKSTIAAATGAATTAPAGLGVGDRQEKKSATTFSDREGKAFAH